MEDDNKKRRLGDNSGEEDYGDYTDNESITTNPLERALAELEAEEETALYNTADDHDEIIEEERSGNEESEERIQRRTTSRRKSSDEINIAGFVDTDIRADELKRSHTLQVNPLH